MERGQGQSSDTICRYRDINRSIKCVIVVSFSTPIYSYDVGRSLAIEHMQLFIPIAASRL